MTNRAVFAALATLILPACATVSERPVAVESPVPKAQQVAARKALDIPESKQYKLKIAIGRFTNESHYGRSLLTDFDLDRIGKQASDMLTSRLVGSEQFVVLERPDLSKVLREQDIREMGFAGDASLVGADTLIVGSVTEFGRSVGGKVGFLSSTKTQTARAKVDIRLVDAKTGHAYFAAAGTGEASTESGEIAGFGSRAAYDATLNDRAIAAAISDVIDKLVSQLSDRRWRTDILDVRGRQVFISGGRKQGLKEGDTLAILEAGETIRSRQTGFDVTLPAQAVATIRVVGLFGETETNEGAVCEILTGSVTKPLSDRLFVAEPSP
jgi:curli biogenesis system outer membrane secretion channel CsgG